MHAEDPGEEGDVDTELYPGQDLVQTTFSSNVRQVTRPAAQRIAESFASPRFP